MSAQDLITPFETAFVSDVMSPIFERKMRGIARNLSFSCAFYGGRMYDFDFYNRHVDGDFSHGNVTLPRFKSAESLYNLVSFWLQQLDGYRLFVDNFVEPGVPNPSIGPASPKDIHDFASEWSALPTNMIIAKGDQLTLDTEALVGIADVSDGVAWLVGFGERPAI